MYDDDDDNDDEGGDDEYMYDDDANDDGEEDYEIYFYNKTPQRENESKNLCLRGVVAYNMQHRNHEKKAHLNML